MKTGSLSLIAAGLLACAGCKNAHDADAASASAAPAATDTAAETATAQTAPTAAVADAAPAVAAADAGDASAGAAGAWRYDEKPGSDGPIRSATIDGRGDDGGAVHLVFHDDPVWGRDAYIEFAQARYQCPTGCKVQARVDGQTPTSVLAAPTETAQPRLSLREPRDLWRSLGQAKTLSIEFPAQGGANGTLTFETAGLDTAKLPGWN